MKKWWKKKKKIETHGSGDLNSLVQAYKADQLKAQATINDHGLLKISDLISQNPQNTAVLNQLSTALAGSINTIGTSPPPLTDLEFRGLWKCCDWLYRVSEYSVNVEGTIVMLDVDQVKGSEFRLTKERPYFLLSVMPKYNYGCVIKDMFTKAPQDNGMESFTLMCEVKHGNDDDVLKSAGRITSSGFTINEAMVYGNAPDINAHVSGLTPSDIWFKR